MSLKNENTLVGLSPTAKFQVGRSDVDNGKVLEKGLILPWAGSPSGSYVYYDCAIGVMLDSGIVVHNRLPTVDRTADTLSSTTMDASDFSKIIDRGVSLKCNDQYADVVQRMGHSRYWFRIWGQALRIGYKVPIPGIKTIGGVPAIPYDQNPQWAYNALVPGSNFGGLPLWRAEWSLWYTTVVPPTSNTIPAIDPSGHMSGDVTLPSGIQVPVSRQDDDAVSSAPNPALSGTTARQP